MSAYDLVDVVGVDVRPCWDKPGETVVTVDFRVAKGNNGRETIIRISFFIWPHAYGLTHSLMESALTHHIMKWTQKIQQGFEDLVAKIDAMFFELQGVSLFNYISKEDILKIINEKGDGE